MSYRDESDALRARIATLEAQLKEKGESDEDEAPLLIAALAGPSGAKRVTRFTQTIDGQITPVGLDAVRQLLWANIGAADTKAKLEEAPPGTSVLTHPRGQRVYRIVESGGKTHLSVDHHSRSFLQVLTAIAVLSATLVLGMIAGGVHDDWIQMFMALFATFVALCAPVAFFRSVAQQGYSTKTLRRMTALAKEHVELRFRARVASGQTEEVEV